MATKSAVVANGSDQVGRNYMAHINSGVIAISQTPNETKFQKTLGVNDYYWGADDSELPLGHIQMLAKSDRNILREGAPWFAPKLALDYMAKHAIDFWLTSEDLPNPGNRVTVDRSGQIHVRKRYYNLEAHRRLLVKPGVTGWAQVRTGYASDCDAMNLKLSYDLWYLRHRSLVLDLAICVKTFTTLVTGNGAR